MTIAAGDMTRSPDYPKASPASNAVGRNDMPPVSVVILTLNEEKNIGPCLESCSWCDDVHLLDSGSSDRTREIAASRGAKVHVHPFSSFGDQRNWAIDNIPAKHPWQFHLDADERFTPAMVSEMRKLLSNGQATGRVVAYLVPSKLIFMDKWLRHSGGYPTYQVRLFRVGRCRFIDFGHGQREDARGEVGSMVNPYLHFNFSKGLTDWFHKHNGYSSREALEAVAARSRKTRLMDLFSNDPLVRRRTLKNLAYHLKGRGFFRFVYMYLIRLGWLDATPGFHYSAMMSTYEYWIELKMQEQEQNWSARTTALARRMLEESPGQSTAL
jgi:glycosyltransferase involved in cell wall biosynthesis